ncbi:MAG: TIGR01777 family oxidoreductase [Cyclobacteriaceae bacterium]|nr:TIGR01777 family oxidoreductase [Cyclobacteriaceae bacterium]
MSKKILITGASGLIGSRLTDLLLKKGYPVSHLSRSARGGKVPSFVWDVDKGEMDDQALKGVETIIHLAGAGVADKRWSKSRKKEILVSRIKSTDLLYKKLSSINHFVTTVVSASAIGYYGFEGDEVLTEDSRPGTDFLADVTKQWEAEVDTLADLKLRVVKLRIGIVLSEKGGALPEMAKPIRLGVGSPLGTGKQQLSWIHIDDLCEMFIHAIETNQMKGAYNGVTGSWVTNEELTTAIARTLKKPLWLPNVPAFVLKMIVGEMAAIVLGGSKVSADKIKKTGFVFNYTELDATLKKLLKR